jgi:hypothetical protein
MFRKARNKGNCHKSNDYGRVTIQAGERGTIGELLWERLDKKSMETLVVKVDCSGVKIVFLSSIVRIEGWH